MEVLDFYTALVEVGVERTISIKLRGLKDPSQVAFVGTLGGNLPKAKPEINRELETLTIGWSKVVNLELKHILLDDGHRFDVKWEVTDKSLSVLSDAISMDHAHWYGCGERGKQVWPIESWKRGQYAMTSSTDKLSSVHERYWLSSRGAAVFVDDDIPLFVSSNKGNDKKLTLSAKWSEHYQNIDGRALQLKYSIIQGKDIVSAHKHAIFNFFQPNDTPLIHEGFCRPIWSTERIYGCDFNQENVLTLASEIQQRGLHISRIDIGHGWTTPTDIMVFDPKRFHDPAAMVSELNKMGLAVGLSITPFCRINAKTSADSSFWIKSGVFPGYSSWQGNLCKVLDFTNKEAVTWYKAQVDDLKTKYGINCFNFDGGEGSCLPHFYKPAELIWSPSCFTKRYVELAGMCSTDHLRSVSFGCHTQTLPVVVAMDKVASTWCQTTGIGSIISKALTLSIMGYPFVAPDYVGGDLSPLSRHADREMYARWLQVCVLMPVLRLSMPPWQYDHEMMFITTKMLRVREEYSELLVELARNWARTGEPIIRPVWWVAPEDEDALKVDSEFLLGNDLLVAPVTKKGAITRDIYLPEGYWRDLIKGSVVQGGKWLIRYLASVSELPLFKRLTDEDVEAIARERMANLIVGIEVASQAELAAAGYAGSRSPERTPSGSFVHTSAPNTPPVPISNLRDRTTSGDIFWKAPEFWKQEQGAEMTEDMIILEEVSPSKQDQNRAGESGTSNHEEASTQVVVADVHETRPEATSPCDTNGHLVANGRESLSEIEMRNLTEGTGNGGEIEDKIVDAMQEAGSPSAT